jgi:integrase
MPRAKQQSTTFADLVLPDDKDEAIQFSETLKGYGRRLRRDASRAVIIFYIIQYRSSGRVRRMTIGRDKSTGGTITEAQARGKAEKLLAQVTLGDDPMGEKQAERAADQITLKQVATDYVEHKKPSLAKNSHAMLHHYVIGQLPGPHKNWRSKRNVDSWLKPHHGKPAHAVTKGDISSALKRCEDKEKGGSGKPSAIALRSAVSAMYAWAIREGVYGVEKNPVIDARMVEDDEEPSEDDLRMLSEGELVRIWQGFDPATEYGRIVRLLILTACRRAEIGSMGWSELDDPQNPARFTIPLARLKNRKARAKAGFGDLVVPITKLAAGIITSVTPRDIDHLFGSTWADNGFQSWSDGKRALDEKIGIPAWRHHHIRRSVSTHLGHHGTPPHVVDSLTGHVVGKAEKRTKVSITYNRSPYAAEVRAALVMWSDHLAELVTRDPATFNEKIGEWLVPA